MASFIFLTVVPSSFEPEYPPGIVDTSEGEMQAQLILTGTLPLILRNSSLLSHACITRCVRGPLSQQTRLQLLVCKLGNYTLSTFIALQPRENRNLLTLRRSKAVDFMRTLSTRPLMLPCNSAHISRFCSK